MPNEGYAISLGPLKGLYFCTVERSGDEWCILIGVDGAEIGPLEARFYNAALTLRDARLQKEGKT